MKIHTNVDYRAARKDLYPDLGDQLDALLALVIQLRDDGVSLPEKTSLWVKACLDVKNLIRKP
jgi:hypothetical protein